MYTDLLHRGLATRDTATLRPATCSVATSSSRQRWTEGGTSVTSVTCDVTPSMSSGQWFVGSTSQKSAKYSSRLDCVTPLNEVVLIRKIQYTEICKMMSVMSETTALMSGGDWEEDPLRHPPTQSPKRRHDPHTHGKRKKKPRSRRNNGLEQALIFSLTKCYLISFIHFG